MTETWCPSEGDRVICIDASYRPPDNSWPKQQDLGTVTSFYDDHSGKVAVIQLDRKHNNKPVREYFAVSRGMYLYWAPVYIRTDHGDENPKPRKARV